MFSLYKQRIVQCFRQHRIISIVVGHVVVMTVLLGSLYGNSFGKSLLGVFAQASCPAGDQTHTVMNGETLGHIAMSNNMPWQELAQHNNLANPNLIYSGQTLCLPKAGSGKQLTYRPASFHGSTGGSNLFPYGQCTYWADERYHSLHGVYVPWMTNSDAWRWTMRANEYHWNVSSTPSVGAIVNLQAWTQGSGGYGHVAIVEKILANGHVMTSNMNWGGGANVTYIEFAPGDGVTFISY